MTTAMIKDDNKMMLTAACLALLTLFALGGYLAETGHARLHPEISASHHIAQNGAVR
jgi:hypothetical protein